MASTNSPTSDPYDKVNGDEEHILSLPGDRQLAYAQNGPPKSRTVILFFTGIMSVGTAAHVPESCRDIQALWISPTLPGMGNSSTRDLSVPYYVSLARDMTALLNHLYPTADFDTLYLAGGSYGTVQAQMLYGAPYDLFPFGRKIAGCLLLSGFSHLKHHVGYAKKVNWHNWFSIGPPTRVIPFHLLQHLFKSVIGSKLQTLDGARAFLKQTIFNTMDHDEKQLFYEYLAKEGLTESGFIEKWRAEQSSAAKTGMASWRFPTLSTPTGALIRALWTLSMLRRLCWWLGPRVTTLEGAPTIGLWPAIILRRSNCSPEAIYRRCFIWTSYRTTCFK
jgi:pimeloyl-ACP methyl ester carboxylesterase